MSWGAACLAAALLLPSCASHAPRRLVSAAGVATSVSELADPAERKMVKRHATEHHDDFDLVFVEFDDQGRLWSLDEMDNLSRTLKSAVDRADGAGVGVVAFAHGWGHDASVCDPFVACFRALLANVAADNAAAAAAAGTRPPRLVGVYFGWRGRSVRAPVVEHATFWSRKRVAERIGAGELVAVLAWLDRFSRHEHEEGRHASLVIVGHSFGGTMVYTALANVFKARLVEALEQRDRVPAAENVVRGFGDLVVLVNPASEAAAFAPLHDLAGMLAAPSPRQTPVLVVVASETDAANRLWFPVGRNIEALLDRTGPRSDRALLTTAIGSYDRFVSHRLEAIAPSGTRTPTDRVEDCRCQLPIGALPADESQRLGKFFLTHQFSPNRDAGPSADACRRGVTFGNARLSCSPGASLAAPIWCVRATDDVVHGHSGFFTRPFTDFLRYLILGGLTSASEPKKSS